ncbi:PLP-dependent aminotransferase family protein [Actinomadura madurae]|uniref:aminotransferase-like domain-containing protein n=1 Tax=Actinomadura madurae TaxID=1993 RepID=UPI0020D228A9|nr:PLP-dependent aminotransferase family protein [Actinomadura madurae]MCP9950237.1 PLP-dependent aminotransferase family protein [Actinomadura madurae]
MRYDLWPSQPDLSAFPRERWIAAARAALRTLPHDALTYPDPAGVPALRAELASYLGRVRAAHADAGRVVIMNGVAHGLSAMIALLRADGHTVLAVEDPTSDRQLPMLAAAGIGVVRVPVDAEGLDVAALAASGARAVLVTPAHQYPTGVVLSAARRAELIAWARGVDGLILEDDYDAEFRYDRDPVGCLQGVDPDRVVLLGSVSKSLAPALRLGWAVAAPSVAERLRDHRVHTDLGAPVLEQHALIEFLAGRRLRPASAHHAAPVPGPARRPRRGTARTSSRRDGSRRVGGHPPLCGTPGRMRRGRDRGARRGPRGRGRGGPAHVVARARGGGAPPALVLGYARLPEPRLVKAAQLLGQAVTHGAGG